ncbi:MAG: hypothetical protein KDK91_30925, partial [Gammaproteobacteria bacterium]|nr:hypothetical protein [Gammaproteobacteria bacterium]
MHGRLVLFNPRSIVMERIRADFILTQRHGSRVPSPTGRAHRAHYQSLRAAQREAHAFSGLDGLLSKPRYG